MYYVIYNVKQKDEEERKFFMNIENSHKLSILKKIKKENIHFLKYIFYATISETAKNFHRRDLDFSTCQFFKHLSFCDADPSVCVKL